ncbi:MAG: hypothetical protein DWQ07_03935 [Chloroflexi bacterium]|nr:MAG: hypothetical protein DWQ07_03935 [Chloroflexota bacterium]MBL1193348.1 hypothetical protein [Chloroflexota bacterium]
MVGDGDGVGNCVSVGAAVDVNLGVFVDLGNGDGVAMGVTIGKLHAARMNARGTKIIRLRT